MKSSRLRAIFAAVTTIVIACALPGSPAAASELSVALDRDVHLHEAGGAATVAFYYRCPTSHSYIYVEGHVRQAIDDGRVAIARSVRTSVKCTGAVRRAHVLPVPWEGGSRNGALPLRAGLARVSLWVGGTALVTKNLMLVGSRVEDRSAWIDGLALTLSRREGRLVAAGAGAVVSATARCGSEYFWFYITATLLQVGADGRNQAATEFGSPRCPSFPGSMHITWPFGASSHPWSTGPALLVVKLSGYDGDYEIRSVAVRTVHLSDVATKNPSVVAPHAPVAQP